MQRQNHWWSCFLLYQVWSSALPIILWYFLMFARKSLTQTNFYFLDFYFIATFLLWVFLILIYNVPIDLLVFHISWDIVFPSHISNTLCTLCASVVSIKEELAKTIVLAYFNPKVDHNIQVDRSMKGLGAVLLQKGRPVIYMSRMLMPTETGYSNIKRELLSMIFRLERLHHYIFSCKVEVQTDHKPFISIWKKSIVAACPWLQWLLLWLAK